MSDRQKLDALGWSAALAAEPALTGCEPARVTRQERDRYLLEGEWGAVFAEVTGRLRAAAQGREDFPVVGDWVWCSTPVGGGPVAIAGILPRRSLLARKVAGARTEGQPLAANVDCAAIVCAANRELNRARIERALAGLWDSGAAPLLVVNKVDVAADREALQGELEPLGLVVPTVFVSALNGEGMEELQSQLGGRTSVFLGSSGVGKSTLINRLLGAEVQEVAEVRAGDDKGRHTTTRRELLSLPGGGLVVDTPGIREFQLWEGSVSGFADVTALAESCRFRDCTHETEPGCAVAEAIASGELEAARLASYRKLAAELGRVEASRDQLARLQEKQRLRQFGRLVKRAVEIRRRQRGDGG